MTDVVIIGGGHSLDKNIEQLKDFKGTVVTTEVSWPKLVELGIAPHYVLSVEVIAGWKMKEYIPKIKIGNPTVVFSDWSRGDAMAEINKAGYGFEIFTGVSGRYIDCGAFACYYTTMMIKPKHIGLIGFDHEGKGKRQAQKWFDGFKEHFAKFMEECHIKENIIFNCTEGGVLSHPDVKNITLKQFIGEKILA